MTEPSSEIQVIAQVWPPAATTLSSTRFFVPPLAIMIAAETSLSWK